MWFLSVDPKPHWSRVKIVVCPYLVNCSLCGFSVWTLSPTGRGLESFSSSQVENKGFRVTKIGVFMKTGLITAADLHSDPK